MLSQNENEFFNLSRKTRHAMIAEFLKKMAFPKRLQKTMTIKQKTFSEKHNSV